MTASSTGIPRFALAAYVVLAAACDQALPTEPDSLPESPTQPITLPVKSVVVEPAAVTITSFGSSIALTVKVYDSANELLSGMPVNWTATDPTVVRVSNQGVLEPMAIGTTTVEATVDGVTGTADVTVAIECPAPAAAPLHSRSLLCTRIPFIAAPPLLCFRIPAIRLHSINQGTLYPN